VSETALALPDGSELRYAISLPDGYDGAPRDPRPLVLALHPGGRSEYYGSWFLQAVVEPALRSWGAFSMGGRGVWHLVARHSDVLTGGVVMAGSPGESDVAAMSATPLYLIHSPDDDVVSFGPVEEAYLALAGRGHPVELRVLPGAGHYAMDAYVPALRSAGAWILERWLERTP
jgi:dipeptidyl aminopeptidase/acylaminoacyl peptidase